jgi:hypothetical protein
LVVGQLLFYALLFAGIIWLLVQLSRRSGGGAHPAQASQARWQHAVQVCSVDPRYRLGQVAAISQVHPQRGTSAWVTWYGTGHPQSTWFEHAYPPVGGWVVVSGGGGRDPGTFHVSQVHDVIV